MITCNLPCSCNALWSICSSYECRNCSLSLFLQCQAAFTDSPWSTDLIFFRWTLINSCKYLSEQSSRGERNTQPTTTQALTYKEHNTQLFYNCFRVLRISGRNQRHQVTSIQKIEAMRDVEGRRDWKAGLGKFLFRNKHFLLNDKQPVFIMSIWSKMWGLKLLLLHLNLSQENSSVKMGPHLEATLTTPITQASRIPLSNQDSEFISTMAPTLPNMAVQNKNCRKTWEMQTGWCL